MLKAGVMALWNHNEEKLEALRNAVLNVAVSSTPGEDEYEMFISLIDTFTPWHLRILAFLADKEAIAEKRGKLPFPSWPMGAVATVLEHVYPKLEGQRDLYDLIVSGTQSDRARGNRLTSWHGHSRRLHACETIK